MVQLKGELSYLASKQSNTSKNAEFTYFFNVKKALNRVKSLPFPILAI
jgi:hypothetical protein